MNIQKAAVVIRARVGHENDAKALAAKELGVPEDRVRITILADTSNLPPGMIRVRCEPIRD
jgi:hypothetical protein